MRKLPSPHEVPDDPEAIFRVHPVIRWAHVAALVVLLGMTVAMLSAGQLSWVVALFVAIVAVQAINTFQLWRWEVVADTSGVAVRQGLRSPRRSVPWERIRKVTRSLPPVLEVEDDQDLPLGTGVSRRLLQRAATHIGVHAARARGEA